MNKWIALLLSVNAFAYADFSTDLYTACQPHIFSGKAHPDLAHTLASVLGTELELAKMEEGVLLVDEALHNQNAFIVQPLYTSESSTNEILMELFSVARALKRASCREVTAIVPYLGDLAQKSLMEDQALLLEAAGVDRLVCIDCPSRELQGSYHKASVIPLSAATIFAPYFAAKRLSDPVVISLKGDMGKSFQAKLEEEGIPTHWGKLDGGLSLDFVGELKGKDLILVTDRCEGASDLLHAARVFEKMEAGKIFACITHAIFSPSDLEELKDSPFHEVVLSDTLPLKGQLPANLVQLSMAPLLAEAVFRSETKRPFDNL
jgi:ribose-phosphate pyrophosphokinase